MDLKTLRTFQLIAQSGSFIRAAEQLNYAQSTVTMQIQKLEADLGVQLIERGKNIRLTEAGRLFYEQSQYIVRNMEQLRESLSDLQTGESGTIRLGVTEPTASYRLPRILSEFISQYPKIRISVDFANTPTLSRKLLEGDIDLALCSAPDLGSELYYEPLFKEQFTVLMPEQHPLASKAVIAPDDLRGHRLLVTSANCPYRKKLEMLWQQSANVPIDIMEIGSMTALKYFVESGLGIALVPSIVLSPLPVGTTVRPMSGMPVDMSFGILTKLSEYPLKQACSRLYKYLKQELLEIEST